MLIKFGIVYIQYRIVKKSDFVYTSVTSIRFALNSNPVPTIITKQKDISINILLQK
jgi:hypothetical protein